MKYRIAATSDCEALTRIRMQMRQELDSNIILKMAHILLLSVSRTDK